MDFLRLAAREARRNATRTLLAVLAVALATAGPILTRMIPEGYRVAEGLAERRFAGGDILIWSAPPPVDSRESSRLTWRPWDGRDWQSHVLYFLPSLGSGGYLTKSPGSQWRPITASGVKTLLRDVPCVTTVRPYLSLPCVVETPGGPFEAVLRGRGPEPSTPGTMGMDELLRVGRTLGASDAGEYNALVPLQGNPIWEESSVSSRVSFEIAVPRLTASSGLSWDRPVRFSLLPVGGYEVKTGEEVVSVAPRADGGARPTVPVFWDRPEVIVTEETFLAIASRSTGNQEPDPLDYPVYQVAVTVERMAHVKSDVAGIRSALGDDFQAYSVPELLRFRLSGTAVPVISGDLWPVFAALAYGSAGVIVTGSVYIILAQERRKIGLLRVIGARRRDVVVYVLGITLYITLTGAVAGFLAGKILSLSVLCGSDLTVREWLQKSGSEVFGVVGLSVLVTAVLGMAVGVWASRIPCAEVLRRE